MSSWSWQDAARTAAEYFPVVDHALRVIGETDARAKKYTDKARQVAKGVVDVLGPDPRPRRHRGRRGRKKKSE